MQLQHRYSSEHYSSKSNHYATALQVAFGMAIDDTTKERWSQAIRLSRGIDSHLDTAGTNTVELQHRATESLRILDSPETTLAGFPALQPAALGRAAYDQFAHNGRGVIRLNQHIKLTTSVSRYAALRRLEGKRYAALITDLATPELAKTPEYQHFKRLFSRIGEVANLMNSFLDLPQDATRGEISLAPSVRNRARLLGQAAAKCVNCL